MASHCSRIAWSAAGAIAVALCGCGPRGSGNAAPAQPFNTGTLSVSMTDVPACGLDAANLTVSRVRVHTDPNAGDLDAGWTDITPNPVQKINLLDLNNGTLAALGQAALAAGHYTQLRVELAANSGTTLANSVLPTATAVEAALDTPSGGIRVGNEFDMSFGRRVDLVLEFDMCRSVFTSGVGKYVFKPSINVVPATENGISGFVAPALARSHVTVSAQQGGAIVGSTVPSTTGEFLLARLGTGNYDVVITADGRAASVIAGVPVATTSSTTVVSTAAEPIDLAISRVGSIGGVVTLSPANADAPAMVAAMQSFVRGPTVTIRYQGVDLSTGAYALGQLPLAAPQFAVFSRFLPLAFDRSTVAILNAGAYSVEASAAGYAAQTVAGVDITTGDQSGVDFTLVQ